MGKHIEAFYLVGLFWCLCLWCSYSSRDLGRTTSAELGWKHKQWKMVLQTVCCRNHGSQNHGSCISGNAEITSQIHIYKTDYLGFEELLEIDSSVSNFVQTTS